jgi:hypothetical protein
VPAARLLLEVPVVERTDLFSGRRTEGPSRGPFCWVRSAGGAAYWPVPPPAGAGAPPSIVSEMMPMRSTPAPRAMSMASTTLP